MMDKIKQSNITVQTNVNGPVEKIWEYWTKPQHITHWNFATTSWHSPYAENDLRVGGKFLSRMEAWDRSMGFDFKGIYTHIELHRVIAYELDDGRNVQIHFTKNNGNTLVRETFEPESDNSLELQQAGWQAILHNFKNYVEKSERFDKLHYEININASANKVYKTMLNEQTYRQWTAIFSPTSRFEGSWNKGDRILFLGDGEDGVAGGMIGHINENIPNRFVSIEYDGVIENGKEIKDGEKADVWSGAWEEYAFMESEGITRLTVNVDTAKSFVSYFRDLWPQALNLLKQLCEAN